MPKNWQENWQSAFEEGYYDNVDGAEDEKKALIVKTDAKGQTKVVGMATGAEAEKIIAEAQASGVEVRRDAAQVEHLMQEQSGATDVPAEVYELMSTIIGFAQELSQEWVSQRSESIGQPFKLATEIEYTLEDVK